MDGVSYLTAMCNVGVDMFDKGPFFGFVGKFLCLNLIQAATGSQCREASRRLM